MRRVLMAAVLLAGCEEYEYAPHVFPISVDEDADPSCFQTEDELEDGVDPGPCRVLLLDPYEVNVGEESVVRVVFDFEDPDGDLDVVRLAAGHPQNPQLQTISADPFDGATIATVALEQTLVFETAGEFPIEVWVVDSAGFESNHLRNVLYAVDPSTPPPE
jgi:hypothetical protein